MKLLKYLFALMTLTALVACGGGGGNPGTSSGAKVTSALAVQVFNSSNVAVSNITFGGGNYVKATFVDSNGARIVGRTVTFELTGVPIAVISPTTALTNVNGEAQVLIDPVSVATVGAATVKATATLLDGSSYTSSVDFSVAPAIITLGPLNLGTTALNPGGNTSVSISAQSMSVAAVGVNISLSADCGTIAGVVTTDNSGLASATYSAVKADGSSCSGKVTLSASTLGAPGVQKASLTVAAPVANAINFVSAVPSQIFIKGSGATEQSITQFKVLDSTGIAMPNIAVVFSLTMNPGGVGLGASGSTANVTVNSDSAGIASVSVFSGTIPGPVEVKAALANTPSVFATSKNLTVASGPPSQNFFSVSASVFNIEGWSMDGSSTTLTARVADRQGNPVLDGTVVNFTAEGGQVAPSCATTRIGGIAQCSVAFISQNPRPADGRISILAYAEGLKPFTDVNGNNVYDPGIDGLFDLGDAYRDDNENGQYDVGEFVIPKNSGNQPCPPTPVSVPSKDMTCSWTAPPLATTVRQQLVVMIPSSAAMFTVMTPATAISDTFVTVRVNSAAHPLLPMPMGTVISADALSSACTIGKITPSIVPNTSPGTPSSQLGSYHSIGLTGCGGSTIVISAKSPGGVVSSFAYTAPAVAVTPPPPPVDTTPPVFTSPPAIDLLTATSARLTAMINEAGTGYYLLQGPGTIPTVFTCPSVAALLLTGTPVAMPASSPVGISLSGLTSGRDYQICFIAKDAAGNQQASVSPVAFTTP